MDKANRIEGPRFGTLLFSDFTSIFIRHSSLAQVYRKNRKRIGESVNQ